MKLYRKVHKINIYIYTRLQK